MARTRTPSYRRLKQSGRYDRAFVELNGKRHYLGRYGTLESRHRYDRLLAEWLAGGRCIEPAGEGTTVVELVAAFWRHAQQHYRHPDGTPTGEAAVFADALKPLKTLYGSVSVRDFGPASLRAVRQAMVDKGWCRSNVNAQVRRLRHVFKWGVANELAPADVLHGLQAVAPLKRGRTDAPEAAPVLPVADEHVNATLSHLTPMLAAMVELQRLTGMRPGEVCAMRTCDIETSGNVWTYTPAQHKTQHHGKARTVYLGPKAQAVLKPRLKANLEAFIFTPVDSERERRVQQHAARKTPLSCGNKPGSNRVAKPTKVPGDRYTVSTYRRAIAYACDAAFPVPDGCAGEELKAWRHEHRWSPNQLRHTFATRVRREHGLEAAQVLLGHARADVTQVYAERDTGQALAVALKVG